MTYKYLLTIYLTEILLVHGWRVGLDYGCMERKGVICYLCINEMRRDRSLSR
jgi:hypothetical protein